jgi:hypothetical protein
MAKFWPILIVLYGLFSFGQQIRFDTLKLPPSIRFKEFQSRKMNYPLVRTGDQRIDSLINFDIKNKLTGAENVADQIDSTLIKWADDVIVFLDFEVTYNQNQIISLNISSEGCGAHCSGGTNYFNYNSSTGLPLSINSIVDTTGPFKKLVLEQVKLQYDKSFKELEILYKDKNSDIDSLTYTWAAEYYNDCRASVDLERFALYPEHFEIIETCDMPNAIKNLTPAIQLKYYFKDIKKYLKLKKQF